MFKFDELPDWQKEAVLIGEVLSAFYGLKPKAHYNKALNGKIERLRESVGTASNMKKEVAALRQILKLMSSVRKSLIPSAERFVRESNLIANTNDSFLKGLTRRGPKSATGNFEYWFLGVIEESKRNKALQNELFMFIKTSGTFENWFTWRFGSQPRPFYFPQVHVMDPRGDFKHTIKDNVLSSLRKSNMRRNPTLSLEKINDSIKRDVDIYRRTLFRPDQVDPAELGMYSYRRQLSDC